MSSSLKILWLKTGPLHPLDTGGKIRTFNMLRALKKRHHITYMSLCPPGTAEKIKQSASEYSSDQIWISWKETPKRSPAFFLELVGNLFSSLPYVIKKYESREMSNGILQSCGEQKFDLIICDFLSPAINLMRVGEKLRTPALLFQHNVEALIWKRMADTAEGLARSIYFRKQWRRLQDFERHTCTWFDGVVGVSEEDCQIMRSEYRLNNVLGSVPTGVDVPFFESVPRQPRPNSVAFLGSMDWMPNIDAVKYFMEEIWPGLKRKVPDIQFTIIGRNPPPAVADLAKKHPGIQVTGTVPDVRPHLAGAQALIVPLRVGGGTRIKIFEAVAAGIPVVSTSIGMEGLPLNHREHILVADSASDFVNATVELLQDGALAQSISDNARKLVRDRYSWDAVTEIFSRYCEQAIRK